MNPIGRGDILSVVCLRGEANKVACVYCGMEGHSSSKCRVVLNWQSRKAILCRNKQCFICLATSYIAKKKCKSIHLCRKCKTGKHEKMAICEHIPTDPLV